MGNASTRSAWQTAASAGEPKSRSNSSRELSTVLTGCRSEAERRFSAVCVFVARPLKTLVRWRSEGSGKLLDRLLDRTPRLGQIVRGHDRVKLDARIEREHPRFRDRRNLRSVLQIEENEARTLAIVVRKIDGLRRQF